MAGRAEASTLRRSAAPERRESAYRRREGVAVARIVRTMNSCTQLGSTSPSRTTRQWNTNAMIKTFIASSYVSNLRPPGFCASSLEASASAPLPSSIVRRSFVTRATGECFVRMAAAGKVSMNRPRHECSSDSTGEARRHGRRRTASSRLRECHRSWKLRLIQDIFFQSPL